MSGKYLQVEPNVLVFIDKASELYGKFQERQFSQDMYRNCIEVGANSPIERLFLIASHALCESQYVDVNPAPFFNNHGVQFKGNGVFLQPQVKIGAYTVDFVLSQNGIGPAQHLSPVIVELDGHDFHDKDKRQRSYEKARDRFLVKQGYKVLHFTGSDVVADPFKVAFEALDLVGVFLGSGIEKYNSQDQLGLE